MRLSQSAMQRLCAVVTLVFFISSNVYAASSVYDVNIPHDAGTVRERWQPSDNSTPADPVIIIEDAHASLEAQHNIARILTSLDDQGLNLVGLEGAVGPVFLEDLRAFPSTAVKRTVMENYLKRGIINGATYHAVMSPKPVPVVGIEQVEHYTKNYEAYRNVVCLREAGAPVIASMGQHLGALRKQHCSAAVLELQDRHRQYENGTLPVEQFLMMLLHEAHAHSVSHDEYLNMCLFEESCAAADISCDAACRDAERIAAVLGNTTVAKDDAALRSLKHVALARGIDLAAYPVFSRYVSALEKSVLIDGAAFVREGEALYNDVLDAVAATDEEKAVLELSREYERMMRVVNLEALRTETDAYFDGGEIVRTETLVSTLGTLSGTLYPLRDVHTLGCLVKTAQDYYALAHERDRIFFPALDRQRTHQAPSGTAALVVGGYHTRGVVDALRERRIPYAVVTPSVTDATATIPYAALMNNPFARLKPFVSTLTSPHFLNLIDYISADPRIQPLEGRRHDRTDNDMTSISLEKIYRLSLYSDFMQTAYTAYGVERAQPMMENFLKQLLGVGEENGHYRDGPGGILEIRNESDRQARLLKIHELAAKIFKVPSYDEFLKAQRIDPREIVSRAIELYDAQIPDPANYQIPLPFPQGITGRGTREPEWHEAAIAIHFFLERISTKTAPVSAREMRAGVQEFFRMYKLDYNDGKAVSLINGLRHRGLIRNSVDDDLRLNEDDDALIFPLVPPRFLALWAKDIEYVRRDLARAMARGRDAFIAVLDEYQNVIDHWPQYPSEMVQRVLMPISLFTREEHTQMVQWLWEVDDVSKPQPLLRNQILLMLDPKNAVRGWLVAPEGVEKPTWVKRQVPDIDGREIYYVAPEIVQLAGGLGRVSVYHTSGAKELGANMNLVQPRYKLQRIDGEPQEIDYAKTEIPVEELAQYNGSFEIIINHLVKTFEVYEGKAKIGDEGLRIPAFLIADTAHYFMNILYEYGKRLGYSNFFMGEFRAHKVVKTCAEESLKDKKAGDRQAQKKIEYFLKILQSDGVIYEQALMGKEKIQVLNSDVLCNPRLYEVLRDHGKLRENEFNEGTEIKYLLSKTHAYRFYTQQRDILEPATEEQQARRLKIKRLNRLLLEHAYQDVCPHSGQDSPALADEFASFFTKAVAEFIRHREGKKKNEFGKDYKVPIVAIQDGQTLPFSAWIQMFYNYNSNPKLDDIRELFVEMLIAGTTHTYYNTQDFEFSEGVEVLARQGVPWDWRWLFLRKDVKGRWKWDLSSAGLRGADVANGVSAVHAFEVGKFDPGVSMLGITNADYRTYSACYMREILQKEMGVREDDIEYVTPGQMQHASRRAIEKFAGELKLDLDPNKFIVAYSGRWVWEKAGDKDCYSPENLKAMAKAGIQVVLFGKVQPYKESEELARKVYQTIREIEADPQTYPGKIIFRPKFNIVDQRKLMAMMHLAFLPSSRHSGASESTEFDGQVTFSLMGGPSYWEGFIQQIGEVISWDMGIGSVVVPPNIDPKSYFNAIMKAAENFRTNERYWNHVWRGYRFSRSYDYLSASAIYLQTWADALRKKEEGVIRRPRPRICNEVQYTALPIEVSLTDRMNPQEKIYPVWQTNNTYDIPLEERRKKDVEVTVKLDLEVNDLVDKRKGYIPLDMVEAYLVNEYHLKIPMKIDRVNSTKKTAFFKVRLPDNVPLPFKGKIMVTSGLWWQEMPLHLSVVRDVVERSQLSDDRVTEAAACSLVEQQLMAGNYKDLYESNVAQRSSEHVVFMKERHVMETLMRDDARTRMFITDVMHLLGMYNIESRNRLVIYVETTDSAAGNERVAMLKQMLRSKGVPELVCERSISFCYGASFEAAVTEMMTTKIEQGVLMKPQHVSMIVDAHDTIPRNVKALRYNVYIPSLLFLAFHVARCEDMLASIVVQAKSLIDTGNNLYKVSDMLVEQFKGIFEQQVVRTAA